IQDRLKTLGAKSLDAFHHRDRLFDRLINHIVSGPFDSLWLADQGLTCRLACRLVAEKLHTKLRKYSLRFFSKQQNSSTTGLLLRERDCFRTKIAGVCMGTTFSIKAASFSDFVRMVSSAFTGWLS